MRRSKSFFLSRILLNIVLMALPVLGGIAMAQENGAEWDFPAKEWERERYMKPDSDFIQLKAHYLRSLNKQEYLAAAHDLQKIGKIFYHWGHYAQSLEYHLQAEKLYEQEHQSRMIADNANDIGLLYYYNRNPYAARSQYNKALDIYEGLEDAAGLAHTYGNLGHLFEKEGKYDSASRYQYFALRQYTLAADTNGMAKICENLGSINEDLARYDSAMYFFTKAQHLYELTHSDIDKIEVLNNIGDIWRKTGDFRKGLEYSRRALAIAQDNKEQYQVSSAYRDIAKAYNSLNINDSAFYFLELSRKYLLQIYSEENNRQVAFFQVQYDIEKSKKHIEQLENERKTNLIIVIASAIILALVAALGIVVINRQRIKIRSEQSLHEKNRQFFESQNRLASAELKSRRLEEEKLKAELKARQLEKENLDMELQKKELEEETLIKQIDVKSKELSTHTLHIIRKNQLLEELRSRLDIIAKDDKRDHKRQVRDLIQLINQNFNNDRYWEDFRTAFEQIHHSFFTNLKAHADDLTAAEMRLVSLIKMNVSSADIATILGISQDSLRVARYRLRKKLGLEQGENLSAFLQGL